MEAPWAAQDKVFYAGKVTKGHVQLVVRKLEQMAERGEWIWPEETDKGYEAVARYVYDFIGAKYTKEELKSCVQGLYDRHVVFNKLLARTDVTWQTKENRFTARSEDWETIIKDDERFGWYRNYGEPMWSEFGCIFDGWAYWFNMTDNKTETVGNGSNEETTVNSVQGTLDVNSCEDDDYAECSSAYKGGEGESDKVIAGKTHNEFGSENSAFDKVTTKFGKK